MSDKRYEIYHDKFWGEDPLACGMLWSAQGVLSELYPLIGEVPESVFDVGCGKGAWLWAAKELGTKYTMGVDGPWNSCTFVEYKVNSYIATDLEDIKVYDTIESIYINSKSDLTICVETAEHLSKNHSTCADRYSRPSVPI